MGMTREERRRRDLERHTVICPHCGGKALDHMTKCPTCSEELVPKGYTPIMSEQTYKRVKLASTIIFTIIAFALLALLVINRQ